jgi:hypothetical protein
MSPSAVSVEHFASLAYLAVESFPFPMGPETTCIAPTSAGRRGILEGAGELVRTVDIGQSDDFVDVGARVKAALSQFVVIGFGTGA